MVSATVASCNTVAVAEKNTSGRRQIVERSEDVNFATVSLDNLDAWPWIEIRIVGRNAPIVQDDILRLLQFIEGVLRSEPEGFGLTYDFRTLRTPSVSVLVAIARWSSGPDLYSLFAQRCIACTTCVSAGWRFSATKVAMQAFFNVSPPTCKTYLVTDFDDLSKAFVWEKPPDQKKSRQPAAAPTEDAREDRNPSKESDADPGNCRLLLHRIMPCARRLRFDARDDDAARLRQQIAELQERDMERQRVMDRMVERIAALEGSRRDTSESELSKTKSVSWCGPGAGSTCPRRRKGNGNKCDSKSD